MDRAAGDRVVGVDLGGTKILAGLLERDGRVVRRRERATPTDSQDALLAALDESVEELLDPNVAAIGLGIPSRIDQRAGRVVSSNNIPLEGLALRERMSERFSRPVGLDNDANVAALAEWRLGAGVGTTTMVMLTLGTGVGGGLILDGRPFRGATGVGAELGHVVVEHDGAPCQGACTGRGHLEALVSGRAAGERAREAFGQSADSHRLVRLAKEGDERAAGILRDIGERLGSAIASFANVFDPEIVVIGGGFSAAGDLLLRPARERVAREALPGQGDVRIERARLGTAAGLVGAGLLAVEALEGGA